MSFLRTALRKYNFESLNQQIMTFLLNKSYFSGQLWSGKILLGWLRKEAREMRGGEALSALNALCEALATHTVVVSWDALFRRAIVAPSGHTFETLLHLLVSEKPIN